MKKLFLLILFTTNLFSQMEEISVHKQHRDENRVDEKVSQIYPSDGSGIIPLKYDKSKMIGEAIFGYLPDWEYQTAAQYLRYDILTHIAAFDFVVNTSGSLTNPSGWPWTNIINSAHQNGVKVILTVVNFDKDQIRTILTNSSVKQTFFTNVKNRMIQYQLDGINIDFEGLYTADRGALLNGFMNELTNFIHSTHPDAEVSFAGPAVNWGGWELSGLANSCDYIFIMGYSFYGSWSTTTGPCAPYSGGSYNIYNTINTQYQAVINSNPQKLILGVPYYGLKWKTQNDQPGSAVIDYISSTRFKNDAATVQQYGMLWSSTHKVPWYRYQSSNEWYQVWYDNDSSLGIKYALAQSKNLRGVGMWALGYDGSRPELWNELYRRFYQTVPVELTSLNYEILPSGILLKWNTATEKNNLGFEIFRRNIHEQNSLPYELAGFINGFGTSTERRNYLFHDKNLEYGTYEYKIFQVDFDCTKNEIGLVEVNFKEIPSAFTLHQNYPNPFNPSTVIGFDLNEDGYVSLTVFDVLGREVATLIDNEFRTAGKHEVELNINDELRTINYELNTNIYFYRLSARNFTATKKLTLMK